MSKQLKLWSSLSVATLVGAGVLSGCDANRDSRSFAPESVAQTEQVAPAVSEAEIEHEHEEAAAVTGGEGEGLADDVDPATDDVAFLGQLGQIRGHLLVGIELFRAGHLDHARTHMKHPEDELYSALKPAFTARGIAAFDSELSDLAEGVNQDKDAADVEAAYETLLEQITRAETEVAASPQQKLLVAAALVRTAGDEYALAVDDTGKLINAHEYQDAFGFVKTAEAIADGIDAGDDEALAAAKAEVKSLLEPLYAEAWPSLLPPDTLSFTASQLFGASARIELEARSLN